MAEDQTRIEELSVRGDDLLHEIKDAVHQGNIRRITIKNDQGVSLIEIPLTLGVVGAVLLPVWAAIGAIAALAVRYTIVIERIETPEIEDAGEPPAEIAEE